MALTSIHMYCSVGISLALHDILNGAQFPDVQSESEHSHDSGNMLFVSVV